ncbi:MAG: TrkA family potassium uptake protein [Coriobacteriia bacterium]|nr:TrkA family potassium uptake protein [Coriobacteriia bacterium]
MFVLVVGGGKLGATVAGSALAEGHEVVVIEKDEERADDLRARLEGATVIAGDGDEPVILERGHVSRASAVLALTGDDEDNLVACLLARREYGVPMTAGRVNDVRNQWLFDERFGVDVAVSGTHLAADLLADRLAELASRSDA